LRISPGIVHHRIKCRGCDALLQVKHDHCELVPDETTPSSDSPPADTTAETKPAEAVAEPQADAAKSRKVPWYRRIPSPSDLIDFGDLHTLLPATGVVLAVMAAIASVSSLVLWLMLRPPVIQDARYLPLDSEFVVTLKWSELANTGWSKLPKNWPGAALASRVSYFAKNAGLKDKDIALVTSGGAPDDLDSVVVYHLAREVTPQEIADREAFRGWRDSDTESERVWGMPIYYIDDRAMGFPDEQTIVNGTRDQVRDVLWYGTGRFRGVLGGLLPARGDASNTFVSRGLQGKLLKEIFVKSNQSTESVIGSIATYTYGADLEFRRTLHISDPEDAERLAGIVKAGLHDTASAARILSDPRKILDKVVVKAEGTLVHVELNCRVSELHPDVPIYLGQLF
jgi:hypothetical protein